MVWHGVTWCDILCNLRWLSPLQLSHGFSFPHACDVIETRFTLVLAGTIVAALLRFDGHSDLAHLHHRSSHIIISSDIICAYLCISVQSWWPFTAWGWSEVLESLRVCSWSNLLAWPHQSAGELAENDPWQSMGIRRGSMGDSKGNHFGFQGDSKGISLLAAFRCVSMRFAGASSLGVSLHCACSQYLPVMSTLPANLVDQTHQQ